MQALRHDTHPLLRVVVPCAYSEQNSDASNSTNSIQCNESISCIGVAAAADDELHGLEQDSLLLARVVSALETDDNYHSSITHNNSNNDNNNKDREMELLCAVADALSIASPPASSSAAARSHMMATSHRNSPDNITTDSFTAESETSSQRSVKRNLIPDVSLSESFYNLSYAHSIYSPLQTPTPLPVASRNLLLESIYRPHSKSPKPYKPSTRSPADEQPLSDLSNYRMSSFPLNDVFPHKNGSQLQKLPSSNWPYHAPQTPLYSTVPGNTPLLSSAKISSESLTTRVISDPHEYIPDRTYSYSVLSSPDYQCQRNVNQATPLPLPSQPQRRAVQAAAVTYTVPKIEYDSFWSKTDDDTFIERVVAPVMAKYAPTGVSKN
ncbi:hypothetical protein BC830DRAFT_1172382 [Chytriomyces sp. MP71]|nr:hypothetical protein BC830DRAFT_1172382 [Chytriomyces sp. MP71]